MELTGNVKLIRDTQDITDSFSKRELVLETQEQYPQVILIEFVQDKCAILDNFDEGDAVKIGINIRGREWINKEGEAKYFNSIQGWKIDRLSNDTPSPQQAPAQKPDLEDDDDDLPF